MCARPAGRPRDLRESLQLVLTQNTQTVVYCDKYQSMIEQILGRVVVLRAVPELAPMYVDNHGIVYDGRRAIDGHKDVQVETILGLVHGIDLRDEQSEALLHLGTHYSPMAGVQALPGVRFNGRLCVVGVQFHHKWSVDSRREDEFERIEY